MQGIAGVNRPKGGMALEGRENQISLRGYLEREPEFSHRMFGESFYKCLLHTPRLSGIVDVLPVTLASRLLGPLEPGVWVNLQGQLRSYNKAIDGVNRLILTIFTLSIEPSPVEDAFNEVRLIGNICKPPIFRTTPFLREIADLLVAVNRPYQKSDYIPCIAWGRTARFGAELLVGAKVEIVGRLQSREYKKAHEDGSVQTRVAYEVSVNALNAL
jgi:hypothetical protein